MDSGLLLARLLLAAVFAVAGVAKLADRAGTRQALRGFHVSELLVPAGSFVLPLAELAVALALLFTASAWWGALGALSLLLAFIVGIGISMARGEAPDCHCFGQLHSEPAGWSVILRNSALLIIAGFVAWQGPRHVGPSITDWMSRLTGGEQMTLGTGLVLLAAVAALGWFVFNLLRQMQRLVARMQSLESTMVAVLARGAERLPEATPAVLPTAPDFALSGVYGETVTLAYLLASGKPLMLLFASSSCGPCMLALTEASRWQTESSATLITVVPIIQGTVAEVQSKTSELGLSNVLIHQTETAAAYGTDTLPSAVIVNADGAIGSEVAVGPDAIRALFSATVGTAPLTRDLMAAPMDPEKTIPLSEPAQPLRTYDSGQQPVATLAAETSISEPATNGHAFSPAELTLDVTSPTFVDPSNGLKETSVGAQRLEMSPGDVPRAPAFALSRLDGRTATLDDVQVPGRPVLLLFASSGCGPCTLALTEAGRWQAEHHTHVTVVPLIQGSLESVQAKAQQLGLADVLIQDSEVAGAYGATMPSAVLVNPDGTLGSEVAAGTDAIRNLFHDSLASLLAEAGPDYAQEPIETVLEPVVSPSLNTEDVLLDGASNLTALETADSRVSEAHENGHVEVIPRTPAAMPGATEDLTELGTDAELPTADMELLAPLKLSSEYQKLWDIGSQPFLADSWQEDGLHFFVFELATAEGTHLESGPPTAVFVMRSGIDEPISAVVVTSSASPEKDTIDLRQPDQLMRLPSIVA